MEYYIIFIVLVIALAVAMYSGKVSTPSFLAPSLGPAITMTVVGTTGLSMNDLAAAINVSMQDTSGLDQHMVLNNGIPVATYIGNSFAVTLNNASGSLTGCKISFGGLKAQTPPVTISDIRSYMYTLSGGMVVEG